MWAFVPSSLTRAQGGPRLCALSIWNHFTAVESRSWRLSPNSITVLLYTAAFVPHNDSLGSAAQTVTSPSVSKPKHLRPSESTIKDSQKQENTISSGNPLIEGFSAKFELVVKKAIKANFASDAVDKICTGFPKTAQF